jgi:hypothetical protein
MGFDVVAFNERVMASIASMPAPTPAGAFIVALKGGACRDAADSLAVAWHLATVRGSSVAPRVRARSMALVLAVATVLATASLVAAAAVQTVMPAHHERLEPLISRPGAIAEPKVERSEVPEPDTRHAGAVAPVLVDMSTDDADTDEDAHVGGNSSDGEADKDAADDDDDATAHHGGDAKSGSTHDVDESDDADGSDHDPDSDEEHHASGGDHDGSDSGEHRDGGSGGDESEDHGDDGDDGGD